MGVGGWKEEVEQERDRERAGRKLEQRGGRRNLQEEIGEMSIFNQQLRIYFSII